MKKSAIWLLMVSFMVMAIFTHALAKNDNKTNKGKKKGNDKKPEITQPQNKTGTGKTASFGPDAPIQTQNLNTSMGNDYGGNELTITRTYYNDTTHELFIYGINFGENPEVIFEKYLLESVDTSMYMTDGYIVVVIEDDEDPEYPQPATYRLMVAREGRFNSASQSDIVDVPVNADGADCPITIDDYADLLARIAALENPGGVTGRFTDMGDGTVRDNNTGLIWLKDATASFGPDLFSAKEISKMIGDGFFDWLTDGSAPGDWRLPTKAEFAALVDTNYSNPALCDAAGTAQWSEGNAFIGVESQLYWSSTGEDNYRVWCMNMSSGLAELKWDMTGHFYYIWPVRSPN